ncbi:hypothetical protein BKA80DRAFT_259117 [Phyllosticta citrichinensis]
MLLACATMDCYHCSPGATRSLCALWCVLGARKGQHPATGSVRQSKLWNALLVCASTESCCRLV